MKELSKKSSHDWFQGREVSLLIFVRKGIKAVKPGQILGESLRVESGLRSGI
jgi:hypothetical protein